MCNNQLCKQDQYLKTKTK